MISRAARRFETTLLSSRQSLPRPARLYSTPSKKRDAPALATAQVPRPDYPAFLTPSSSEQYGQQQQKSPAGFYNELESFLNRPMPYTIIPTPLPHDRTSEQHEHWYADTVTQDLAAVMDACLHNLYDVPRAMGIFERLR
ncbi:hypothetical protein BDQ12DRAFT_591021, partial [Crucibulum laeve]